MIEAGSAASVANTGPDLSTLSYNNLLITCRLNISDYIQSKEHIQLARDMATQTMVLLKNDQSKGLPITSPKKKACVNNR